MPWAWSKLPYRLTPSLHVTREIRWLLQCCAVVRCGLRRPLCQRPSGRSCSISLWRLAMLFIRSPRRCLTALNVLQRLGKRSSAYVLEQC
ncbi:unnamed protein product [Gadus morhua 'NCC']